jgi:hypothetical protein
MIFEKVFVLTPQHSKHVCRVCAWPIGSVRMHGNVRTDKDQPL